LVPDLFEVGPQFLLTEEVSDYHDHNPDIFFWVENEQLHTLGNYYLPISTSDPYFSNIWVFP
jgi:hypothetical protein